MRAPVRCGHLRHRAHGPYDPAAGVAEWLERGDSKGGGTCIGPSSSLTGAKAKYDEALAYLRDGKKTSFIFVLKPEHLSIVETRRSSDELAKLGIHTSLLIVNGVLPDEAATDTFFKNVREQQQMELDRIDAEFSGTRRVRYPLKDGEVKGKISLEAVGKYLIENKLEEMPRERAHEIRSKRDVAGQRSERHLSSLNAGKW